MLDAAEAGHLDDASHGGELDGPVNRSILVEREVGPEAMIVRDVVVQVATQATLVLDNHVVEALAPQGADEAFDERILPGRVGRRQDFLDAEGVGRAAEDGGVDTVAIAEQEAGRHVVGPGFAQLLRCPGGGGVGGHVDVDNAPASVGEDHEHEQDAEGGGRDGEEVTRGELRDVVDEEGPPRLGGRSPLTSRPSQVLADGGLRDVEAELSEFGVNARGTPEGVGGVHLPDQGAQVGGEGGSPRPARPGPPAPSESERLPMPANDGVGRDDLDGAAPVVPEA